MMGRLPRASRRCRGGAFEPSKASNGGGVRRQGLARSKAGVGRAPKRLRLAADTPAVARYQLIKSEYIAAPCDAAASSGCRTAWRRTVRYVTRPGAAALVATDPHARRRRRRCRAGRVYAK